MYVFAMELGIGRWAGRKNGIWVLVLWTKTYWGGWCHYVALVVKGMSIKSCGEMWKILKNGNTISFSSSNSTHRMRWDESSNPNQVFQCITVQYNTPTQTGHKNSHEGISKNHKMKRKMFLVIMILFSFFVHEVFSLFLLFTDDDDDEDDMIFE